MLCDALCVVFVMFWMRCGCGHNVHLDLDWVSTWMWAWICARIWMHVCIYTRIWQLGRPRLPMMANLEGQDGPRWQTWSSQDRPRWPTWALHVAQDFRLGRPRQPEMANFDGRDAQNSQLGQPRRPKMASSGGQAGPRWPTWAPWTAAHGHLAGQDRPTACTFRAQRCELCGARSAPRKWARNERPKTAWYRKRAQYPGGFLGPISGNILSFRRTRLTFLHRMWIIFGYVFAPRRKSKRLA